MKKSVGTITFHNALNFGACLQAYALQRTIQSLGHTTAIIDYARPACETAYRLFRLPRNRSGLKHDLHVLSTLRSQLKLRERFNEFRKLYMETTPRSYHSYDDLQKDHLAFDIFVTGSDIVWQPAGLEKSYGSIFYLNFVRAGRRVAYAPSFGGYGIPDKHRDQVASLLRRFEFLSCREKSGCKNIQECTGQEAAHVLDPTLLQNGAEYDKIAATPTFKGPYILLYPMQMSNGLSQAAMKARQVLKLPIVAVLPVYRNPWKFRFADKVICDAGPREFLGWMKNSTFVCSNSFHGAAFSIIYRKQFLLAPAKVMNTRLLDLLERLGLAMRQVNDVKDLQPGHCIFDAIDYAPVGIRLKQAVEESLTYLRQALA